MGKNKPNPKNERRKAGAATAIVNLVLVAPLAAILMLSSTIEFFSYPIIREFAGMFLTFVIMGICWCVYQVFCGLAQIIKP